MGKKKNAVVAVPIVCEASSVAATAGDATLDNNTTSGGTTTSHNRNANSADTNRGSGSGSGGNGGIEEIEIELLQVDLGDMVKLKQVLDESVVAAILEHFPEDYAWDNLKLAIMFAACLFAMIAQFAPLPFPECRPVLGVCGSLYFVLSGVLQAIATFIDKDTILWSPSPVVTPASKKEGSVIRNKDLEKYGVRVRSSLPRFSEWFTVTLELYDSSKQDKTRTTNSSSSNVKEPLPYVSQTWSIGQFFDKDGYFDEIGLGLEVDKLFDRLDASKYDVDKSKTD